MCLSAARLKFSRSHVVSSSGYQFWGRALTRINIQFGDRVAGLCVNAVPVFWLQACISAVCWALLHTASHIPTLEVVYRTLRACALTKVMNHHCTPDLGCRSKEADAQPCNLVPTDGYSVGFGVKKNNSVCVCVCIHAHMEARMYLWIRVQEPRKTMYVFLYFLPPCFPPCSFETGSLTELGTCSLVPHIPFWLLGQQVPAILLPSLPHTQRWDCRSCLAFYADSGDWNSGHHSCTASAVSCWAISQAPNA